jgi:hypothetical protein
MQAGFASASPMVTPELDGVYFCMVNSVYHVGLGGSTEIVCSVPGEYIGQRHYSRVATHLTGARGT